jgi:hypothetical protein
MQFQIERQFLANNKLLLSSRYDNAKVTLLTVVAKGFGAEKLPLGHLQCTQLHWTIHPWAKPVPRYKSYHFLVRRR